MIRLEKILSEKKWAIGILVFFCLVIYGKNAGFGYALDDHLINTFIPGREEGLKGIRYIFSSRFGGSDYRPVLILSFALEKWIFGVQNPAISHVLNVLLYLLLCLCIYHLLLQLPLGDNKKIIAFSVALLFVCHPVHANVVSNLKSRDNLLSMLFGICATIQFLRSLYTERMLKFIHLLSAGAMFVLAVLSKLDALGFVFFVVLLLILYYPKKISRLLLVVLVCFILYAIFYSIIPESIAPVNTGHMTRVTYTENPFANDFTFTNRMGAASMTGLYYLKMMLVPYGYWFYFGYDQVRLYPINSVPAIAGLLLLFCILSVGILNHSKNKLLSLGILSFFAFLIYCFNYILPVAGIIADRYAFMASLGFCMALAAVLFAGTQTKRRTGLLLSLCFLWAGFSFNRADVWKDGLTLIENDMPHLERSYEAQRMAAMHYVEQADKTLDKTLLEKALYHIQRANAIYPDNSVCQLFEGIIQYKIGNTEAANIHYRISLKNDTTNIEALEMLGDLKYEQKQPDSARYFYNRIRTLYPAYNAAVNKISTLIFESGNMDSVIRYNSDLMKTDTSLYAPYENLGYFYLTQKDTIRATEYFRTAAGKGLPVKDLPVPIR